MEREKAKKEELEKQKKLQEEKKRRDDEEREKAEQEAARTGIPLKSKFVSDVILERMSLSDFPIFIMEFSENWSVIGCAIDKR